MKGRLGKLRADGSEEMKRKIIYFLCTGDSARSQMAEGFAKKYLDFDQWDVRSAGVESQGLNPLTREVMQELDIDISNQRSSIMDTSVMNNAEVVVTLCDAAKAAFPANSVHGKIEHWNFEDPTATTGTKAEQLTAFRRVRDQIDTRIKELIEVLQEVYE